MAKPVLHPGQADQHGGAAIGGVARQFVERGAAGILKGGLQHQILGRIAGEEQFGKHHHIGAETFGFFTRGPGFFEIGVNRPDDAIDLRQSQDKAVGRLGRKGHAPFLGEGGRAGNRGARRSRRTNGAILFA